ncbi:hypothetical protein BDR04DRAFT_1114967 [Suillus decipiens]|nr:hypothetical protein BDR04DRAFT_1114967 [Suillus decipiens]
MFLTHANDKPRILGWMKGNGSVCLCHITSCSLGAWRFEFSLKNGSKGISMLNDGWIVGWGVHECVGKTLLSFMIHAPASGAFVYVVFAQAGASVGMLPVIAKLQTLGIDKTAFWVPSTGCGGLVVPQELALALVHVVGEMAKAQGASMEARWCCATLAGGAGILEMEHMAAIAQMHRTLVSVSEIVLGEACCETHYAGMSSGSLVTVDLMKELVEAGRQKVDSILEVGASARKQEAAETCAREQLAHKVLVAEAEA